MRIFGSIIIPIDGLHHNRPQLDQSAPTWVMTPKGSLTPTGNEPIGVCDPKKGILTHVSNNPNGNGSRN